MAFSLLIGLEATKYMDDTQAPSLADLWVKMIREWSLFSLVVEQTQT